MHGAWARSGRRETARARRGRAATLVVVTVAVLFLLAVSAATPASVSPDTSAVSVEAVDVGMPFTGKWAYNVPAARPYDDIRDSHPAAHHTPGSGNWGTDLYAAAGTTVRLRLANATGRLTYSWASSSTSCGSSVRINVSVDGRAAGWIYVAHLANAVRSGPISNGMALGTVTTLGCIPVPHVHVEMRNASGYACYVDHGQPGASTLASATPIGRLGYTAATTNRQRCPNRPPIGAFDSVSSPAPGRARVRGWAADLDAPRTALVVQLHVDGRATARTTANLARTDVARAYPALGAAHGFDHTFTVAAGRHTVCAYAVVARATDPRLGCKAVTIAAPPTPTLDCNITQSRSIESVTRSEIVFANASAVTIDVYWLDFSGQRVFYYTLEAGRSYLQRTWLTHPWVAVDRSGTCHGYTLSDSLRKTYVIP